MQAVRHRLRALPVPTTSAHRVLLHIGAMFLVVNLLALWLVRGARLADAVMLLVWGLCAYGGQAMLARWLPSRDPYLFPLVMTLCGWGLLVIDRLSNALIYNFAYRQTLWMVLGVALALVFALRPEPLRWLRTYRYLLLIVGLLLLGLTIAFGVNPSGSVFAPRLWLAVGPVFVQPSELLKIVLVTFVASYLAEQAPALRALAHVEPGRTRFLPSARVWGPVLLMWLLSVVLLVWQRDLGTAALFFAVFVALLYAASDNRWVLVGGGVLLLVAGVLGACAFAVVRLRVDVWLNPWPEAPGRAYQIVQSLLAFAAGGVYGRGIGQGTPTVIPVVHSDFVYAAIGEEWGLLGTTLVLAALALIVVRGLQTSLAHQGQPFYALTAVGLSTLLAMQTLLICGGVLKVLPLTGVTLPFLSYGGSSLVMCFAMVGLLLRLSASGRTS